MTARNDGMVFEFNHPAPSHPLIREPQPSDFVREVVLEVEYSMPDQKPVQEGDVLYAFRQHEWRDIISVTPNPQVIFGLGPLASRPVAAQTAQLQAATAALVDAKVD